MAAFTELATFPAGLACAGFDLKIGCDGTGVRVNREPGGGVWHSISAGTGADLRFTNVSTNASLTLQGNGAVAKTQNPGADGSTIVELTGHNILIMFPTDTPPGPSNTLYVGKLRYSVDALNNTTVLSSSGRQLDICAALAP